MFSIFNKRSNLIAYFRPFFKVCTDLNIFEKSAPLNKCFKKCFKSFLSPFHGKKKLRELLYTPPTLLISFQTCIYESENKILRQLRAHVALSIIKQ